jgi:uncharacterized protein Usg
MILKEKVTVGVIYWMPDHRLLLNEFWWQHMDLVPELPRTHQFLIYWKNNIDAVIRDVYVMHSHINSWQRIDWEIK